MDMGFRDRVITNKHNNPADIAEDLIKFYLNNPDVAKKELAHVIRSAVSEVLRDHVKKAEEQAFSLGPPRFKKRAKVQQPRRRIIASQPKVNDFRDERVSVPGFGLLTWGEMTIRQHELRVVELTKHINGTRRAIERHQWAIRELRSQKVVCLNDLDYAEITEIAV